MNLKLNLFVALLTVVLFSACDSEPPKPPANYSASNLGGPQNTSPSNAANNANQMAVRGPEGLPNLSKGEDYRRLRIKMIDSGWTPARSEKQGRENCASASDICKELPELESGPAAGEGKMALRWQRGDRVVQLYTVGDPAVYDYYRFEKKAYAPTPNPASNKAANTNTNANSKPSAKPANAAHANKPEEDADAEEGDGGEGQNPER